MKSEGSGPSEGTGEQTLRTLSGIPPRSRVALLIRHSEREGPRLEEQPASVVDEWQLTPRGRNLARRFGTLLPAFDHLVLSHTPVPRTRDTAEEIANGFRALRPSSEVRVDGPDLGLGLTTFYAIDRARRDDLRQHLGWSRFLRAWLDGEIPPTVLTPAREAVSDLVGRIHSQVQRSPESSLRLAVGHDVNLFVVREVLFGSRPGGRSPIDFLDGVALTWEKDGRWVARWGHESAAGPRR